MANSQARPHAVIVGVSSGLGAGCAKRLSGSYNITGLSRRGLLPDGIPVESSLALVCDATSPDVLKTCLDKAVNSFGKISLMIVTAGKHLIKPARNVKEQEVHALLKANMALPVFVSSLFASQRFTHVDAVLCLVSSIAAFRPEAGIVLYGATKAATNALVAGLAKELAPRRVVGVSPSWLDTPMTQAYPDIYTPNFVKEMKLHSPLGLVNIEDVLDGIEFLVSAKAKMITGQVLVIDGGISL